MRSSTFIIFLKTLVLVAAITAAAYLLFLKLYVYGAVVLIVTVAFAFQWASAERRLLNHMLDFSEAVRYRDFTRRFAVKHPSRAEGQLFNAFNTINNVYRQISVDKEIQHQYLNKVINMLDSGIIFYRADTGKVEWINDAFKQLFQTPHLGNIKGLEKRHPDLYVKTVEMPVGTQQIEAANSAKGKIKLLMHCVEFESQEGVFRVVVFQNINEAIDRAETVAWQKLLRVLTHEIMNSIAPISSLADTLHARLAGAYTADDIEDMKVGIYTIKRRSEALLQFAKSYRLINKVDQPNFVDQQLKDLFENVYQLFEPTLIQKNIELDIILKDTRLVLRADANLVEQIIINLLLNAIEAVKTVSEPYVSITGKYREGHIVIKVKDNGDGMSQEVQEQIFTPFFTTKKTGSGVGLTLCKQIMLLHKGTVSVDSTEGRGSCFTLQFPA